MGKQIGYILENELRQSFEHFQTEGYRFFYHKIPDTRAYTKLRCPECENWIKRCPHCENPLRSALCMPETIGDFIVIGHKGVAFLEAKATGKEFFPIPNIKKHQRLTAVQVNSYDSARYFFYINDRAKPRHFRLFMVDADKMEDVIEQTDTPRDELSWEELEGVSTELPRMPDGLWDLRELLDLVCEKPLTEEDIQRKRQVRWDRKIMAGEIKGNKWEAFKRSPMGQEIQRLQALRKRIDENDEIPDIEDMPPGPYEMVLEEDDFDKFKDNSVYIHTALAMERIGFNEDQIVQSLKDLQLSIRHLRCEEMPSYGVI